MELLREQAAAMGRYLYILEVRAEIENVCLEAPAVAANREPDERACPRRIDPAYIEDWERALRETGATANRP